jgi:hypothetical protein
VTYSSVSGQHLALFSSPRTLEIHSVHSGKLINQTALQVASSELPLIRWLPLDLPKRTSDESRDPPWVEQVIRHLPDLPELETPKDASSTECVSLIPRPFTVTTALTRSSRGEPFLFGSAKPASSTAAPKAARPTLISPSSFPALSPSHSTDSFLIACSNDRLDLFLGGCLHLGHIDLPPSSQPLAASFYSSLGSTIGLFLLRPDDGGSQQLQHVTIFIPLDDYQLGLLAKGATSMGSFFDHAFHSLEDATEAWEEARSVGEKWLDRLRTHDSHGHGGRGGLSCHALTWRWALMINPCSRPDPRSAITEAAHDGSAERRSK